MINYKGILGREDEEKQYYEGGAHFKYSQLVKVLEELLKESSIVENSKEKETIIHSQRIFKPKLKMKGLNIEKNNFANLKLNSIKKINFDESQKSTLGNIRAQNPVKFKFNDKSRSCDSNRLKIIKEENKNNDSEKKYKEKITSLSTIKKHTLLQLKSNSIYNNLQDQKQSKILHNLLMNNTNFHSNLNTNFNSIINNSNNNYIYKNYDTIANDSKRYFSNSNKKYYRHINVNPELPKIDSMYYNYRCSTNRKQNFSTSTSVYKKVNQSIKVDMSSHKSGISKLKNEFGDNAKDRENFILSNGLLLRKNERGLKINMENSSKKENDKPKNYNLFLKDNSKINCNNNKNKIEKNQIQGNLYIRNIKPVARPVLTDNNISNHGKK